jgi:uncharacterized membrane protein (UPF0127 family)
MKKKSFRKKIIISLLILASLVFLCWFETRVTRPARTASVRLGETTIAVEVASTPQERYQGLSDRASLGAENGMLYAFMPPEMTSFVMRRMDFPLDMIWIRDGQIVKIDAQLPPEPGEPYHLYEPPIPVDYVLEVNAGFSARHGLTPGTPASVRYSE